MKELELLEDTAPKLTAEQLDYYRKKYLEDTAQIFEKYVKEEQKKDKCVALSIYELNKLALATYIYLKARAQFNDVIEREAPNVFLVKKDCSINIFCAEMKAALQKDGCAVYQVLNLVSKYFAITKSESNKIAFYLDGYRFEVNKRYDNQYSNHYYEPKLAYRVQSKIFGIEFIDIVYLKDFSKLLGFKELYEKKLK